jgi:cell division initiation protein
MNISPLDLRQQKFSSAFMGYDKTEVTALLIAAADDYEQALRETDRLRQDLTKLDGVLAEYRDHEKILNTTLIAAQKLADDITAHAEEESDRIIREAQGRADLLIEQTQVRFQQIQREVDGLQLQRRNVETSIEATIQTLRHTLELVREQDGRCREDHHLLYGRRIDPVRSERASAAGTEMTTALAGVGRLLEPPVEGTP